MKKTFLLNQALSRVIAGLGHLDELLLADAGLPIPADTERIDLAVSKQVPSLMQVLEASLSEMQVERVLLASEMAQHSPDYYASLVSTLQEALPDVPIVTISHEELKTRSRQCKAVVRTGECTPYVNVILVSGVVF